MSTHVPLSSGSPLLELAGVCRSFGGVVALEPTTLAVVPGELRGLVGENGAGKSTLIDLLPLLREPSTGQILFDGTSQAEFNLKSLRAGIAYAPQSPQVFNASIAVGTPAV